MNSHPNIRWVNRVTEPLELISLLFWMSWKYQLSSIITMFKYISPTISQVSLFTRMCPCTEILLRVANRVFKCPFEIHWANRVTEMHYNIISPLPYCNTRYPCKTHLKLTSRPPNLVFYHIYIPFKSFVESLWNFAETAAVIRPCSVQNVKTIWQLRYEFWPNEIPRDLSLRCVSDGYPIMHQGSVQTQREHDAIITSLWRQNDVVMTP